ncbi:hypothetical protein D7V80_16975 [Corallococcus sp. CA054B]|uniref:hypothetical protein n=1 Tax=Corallococcus sp. CA054B TaxID=2316734 RepID=UPI000EA0C104|nr:hypothetical protein [Corallococcus sp. CA054B]RKG67237.1 hypothetical protein D7V80_16975 [Corallococcus sp. CA054B]
MASTTGRRTTTTSSKSATRTAQKMIKPAAAQGRGQRAKSVVTRSRSTVTPQLAAEPVFAWAELKPLLKARARNDPDFRKKLLAHPEAAFEEAVGYPLPKGLRLQPFEETPQQLYIIVPRSERKLTALEIEVVQSGLDYPPSCPEDCPGDSNPPSC